MDFFNPEGLNIRGASTSCGIISMACLNSPLDIRYKPENMYLMGIIPDAWQCGIKYSKTTCCPNGQLTHSAIALIVCDLPAAHHIASMAGVSSHFYCSACNCYHRSTCGRVDFEKDAATSSKCEKLFKAHGVHYSKLWHLPYWDPSQQLVIDPMHCLLEGLVQHHTQNLLSLTLESTTLSSSSLAFTCNFGEVPPRTMTAKEVTQKVGRMLKIDYIKALLNWVSSNHDVYCFIPKNFGEASAGTIKADEWQSLITIYLPIALVSLWEAGTSHSSDELTVCLRTILDHTMELVCAVYIACAQTMTARRAQAYRSHIAAYVGQLQKIHPTFPL
ncbi:hypothetical protein BDR04DRAFT_1128846 [Suillus decipiens]|nr:hypothetical protein BDR04DRAFT_1128846 [Suillus decipiens]